MSLFTSAHFKSANAVYNILGEKAINEVIAQTFGQPIEAKSGENSK
jgi:peptidyl-prolyl cis-trans isomerase C